MKIKTSLLIIVFCYIPLSAYAGECFNVDKPTARVIYLHGMDSKVESKVEKNRKDLLKKISKENNIEMYFPRASMACLKHKGMVCWMWGSDSVNSLKAKQSELISQANKCFKSKTKLIYLGFSNGGNFINQLYQACLGGNYAVIGASGGRLDKGLKELSKCGNYIAGIGVNDKSNYVRANKLYYKFKSLNGKVQIIKFEGGHEVPKSVLLDLFKRFGINSF